MKNRPSSLDDSSSHRGCQSLNRLYRRRVKKTRAPRRTTTPSTQSVEVRDALQRMLEAGDRDGVLALFDRMQQSHAEQLRSLLDARRPESVRNEGVTTNQLALALVEFERKLDRPFKEADDKLAKASGADSLDESQTPEANPPKQPPRRRPIPDHVPRVPNPILVPLAERPCPTCGAERRCIGHERTEVIDIEPARVIVRVDEREKLACDVCEAEVVRAPLGDKVVDGGSYGSRLCAELLVGKYDDGLPLHRQKQRIERLGLSIPESSLGDQITWSTDLLRPIWRYLIADVINAEIMHVDGTSLPVLDRDDPRGIKTGVLWGYVGVDPPGAESDARAYRRAVYLYTGTGHKIARKPLELGPESVLGMRAIAGRRFVVADAAGLFDASFADGRLVELGCNMHGRRYFEKAFDAKDARAALPIAAYKKLYDIEESVADASANERLAARREQARPVYDELLAWIDAYRPNEPPKSLLGAALRYVNNHRVALTRYLDDGSLPIDNGIVERLHRRPAIGRISSVAPALSTIPSA